MYNHQMYNMIQPAEPQIRIRSNPCTYLHVLYAKAVVNGGVVCQLFLGLTHELQQTRIHISTSMLQSALLPSLPFPALLTMQVYCPVVDTECYM